MQKRFHKLIAILGFTLFFLESAKAQVNISDSATAAALVQALVGTGITYSNPVLNCKQNAEGTFSVISSNLGLSNGIILTTGRAETDPNDPVNGAGANGPQTTWFPSGCNNGGQNAEVDPDLDSLVTQSLYDVCALEFDFVPDGDSLLFDYVFGSEEYDSYSCSGFNDVFGFFLSGPGITGNPNVALIPGTNIPVAINSTTNPAVTNPGSLTLCQAMGPGSPFAQYYVDNSVGTSITYYGFTTVLTARAAVLPCTTYHIKLAIADAGDCVLDSGVFLAGNSFRSTNIKLNLQSSLGQNYDYLVEGCTQAVVTVKRNHPFPIPQTVKLSYGGTATQLQDYTAVPDSLVIPANDTVASFSFDILQDNVFEGLETVQVNIVNPCTGVVIDSVVFKIYDYLPYTFLGNDTTVCAGQGVRLEVDGDTNFTWYWRGVPSGQIDDATKIKTYAHPDTTTTYYVSATFQGCVTDTSDMLATVEPNPFVHIIPNDTAFCLSDPYPLMVISGPDYFSNYTYTWTPPEYLSDPTARQPEFFTRIPGDYKYMLTVTTPIGCTGSDTVHITARPAPELINVSHDTVARYGDKVQLNVEGATYYTWTPTRLLDYPNEPNPTAHAIDTATFQIIGTDQYGCRDTAYVHLGIDYTMFEYVPNAFSPNGDGRNDVFSIKHMHFQKLIEFRIFNRWGQEVYSAIDPNKGWDGTYQGVPQEIGVYQYLIRIVTPEGKQRTYKGDVSLIR